MSEAADLIRAKMATRQTNIDALREKLAAAKAHEAELCKEIDELRAANNALAADLARIEKAHRG